MSKYTTIAILKDEMPMLDELVRRDLGKPSRVMVVRRLIHEELERQRAKEREAAP